MGANRASKVTTGGSGRTITTGGKIGASLCFLFFGVMGAVFLVLIVRDFSDRLATWRWVTTPCVIEQSEVVVKRDNDHGYGLSVRYRYAFNGHEHTSNQYQKDYKGESTYESADKIARRFPVESTQTCYVDPANPFSAVLERSRLWIGLFVVLPLIFVLIGVGGIWSTLRTPAGTPVVPTKTRTTGARGMLLFWSVFALLGGSMVYAMLVRPLLQIYEAKSWTPTACTILSSRVASHPGKSNSTYSVDVFYSYVFNDREYKSSRYSFNVGSTSTYDGKADAVRNLPVGSAQTCYVDPADPTSAVLNRGATADLWFGAIPGVFLLVGVWGIVWTIFIQPRRNRAKKTKDLSAIVRAERRRAGVDVAPSETLDRRSSGLIELRPTVGPVGKVLFGLLFSLFWNGVISIFLYQAFKSWRSGSPDLCLTLFMVPFVLVGVGMIGFTLHALLAIRNPRVVLRVSANPVFTGETVLLEWELIGSYDSVERLLVTLKGQVTERKGKQTTNTDLHSQVVLDETRRMNLPKGKSTLHIPPDARPSDDNANDDNQTVTWKLTARAYIPNWPDSTSDHVIRVIESQTPGPEVTSSVDH